MTADMALVSELAAADNHLAVFATTFGDGTVHASVVSTGVIDDPIDGSASVGVVVGGDALKLRLLRRSGRATVVFKSGFRWAAVSGVVRLIGPDDPAPAGVNVAAILRAIFGAAGGSHEDWDEFDQVMADERRCGVFVRADTVSTNPGASST